MLSIPQISRLSNFIELSFSCEEGIEEVVD